MLKSRQLLGKYRIERRIADGAFAGVYRALDTIEGVRVALKVPHAQYTTKEFLEMFRHEVRLMAKLDHPNILALKDAGFIDRKFIIAVPLAERTLADRLRNRLALRTSLDYAEQMIDAIAHAHANRIIHCDIKPENLLLFSGNRLRLTDFGIAKVARHTIHASGSGTVGYMAPEQAMGKPSLRSDIFSTGLVLYRMFSGSLPEWPYTWPPAGYARLTQRAHPDLIKLIRKAMELDPKKRFRDGVQMQTAFRRVKGPASKFRGKTGRPAARASKTRDWKTIRKKQFQKDYRAILDTRYTCNRCGGPVSEAMHACPWCGTSRSIHRDNTSFPVRCPRCNRGLKADWTYCPWCHGPGFEVEATREYPDRRYEGRCSNSGCTRKVLMPFMRYCPWCRRKVRKKWKLPDSKEQCASCGWGIVRSYWDYCPWCTKRLPKR